MAITKTEGIFQDIVVIYYQGNWYGIPFTQLVQLSPVQRKYGLNVNLSKLVAQQIQVDVMNDETTAEAIIDMVKELRLRIEQQNSDFVAGLKVLIGQNILDFAPVLSSNLIP